MTIPKKEAVISEGKAKVVYATSEADTLWLTHKDEATALNGKRKAHIEHKGRYTNQISGYLFRYLKKQGIASHYLATLNDHDSLVKRLTMFPVEVVIRNVAAGHFTSRFAYPAMRPLTPPVQEFYLKADELDDPMINDSQLIALSILTTDQIDEIRQQALHINQLLTQLFASLGITLLDLKLEFGLTRQGKIVLADELSPDNMRLQDQVTHQSLDKDVFRQQKGDLRLGYGLVLDRLASALDEED